MVKVVATCYLKEEKVQEYLELAKEIRVETVKEKGCKEYILYRDKEDQNVFSFIEEWETQEDLDAHMKSEHFERIIPLMVPLFEKDLEVRVYDYAL
jgi:quinol monooxygenase YgiN